MTMKKTMVAAACAAFVATTLADVPMPSEATLSALRGGGTVPAGVADDFFAPFREVGLNAPEPRIYWAKPVLCRSADGEVLRNLKILLSTAIPDGP